MLIKTHIISKEEEGLRIDRWFKINYPSLSFSYVAKLCRSGQVRVDGKRTDINQRLIGDQSIRFPLFTQITENKKQQSKEAFLKRYSKLGKMLQDCVIYKDDMIIAIDKPSGLAVQGGTKVAASVDSLLDYLKFEYDVRPHLVHRIDKDTSGILILARTREAAKIIGEMFQTRGAIKKTYIAIVRGTPLKKEGVIDFRIAKKKLSDDLELMAVDSQGQEALTRYKVLEKAGKFYSLVELEPITGRTHQIRVHMRHINCGVLGDKKFDPMHKILDGIVDKNKLYLHAHKISLIMLGKKINITAKFPIYFIDSMKNLGFATFK